MSEKVLADIVWKAEDASNRVAGPIINPAVFISCERPRSNEVHTYASDELGFLEWLHMEPCEAIPEHFWMLLRRGVSYWDAALAEWMDDDAFPSSTSSVDTFVSLLLGERCAAAWQNNHLYLVFDNCHYLVEGPVTELLESIAQGAREYVSVVRIYDDHLLYNRNRVCEAVRFDDPDLVVSRELLQLYLMAQGLPTNKAFLDNVEAACQNRLWLIHKLKRYMTTR